MNREELISLLKTPGTQLWLGDSPYKHPWEVGINSFMIGGYSFPLENLIPGDNSFKVYGSVAGYLFKIRKEDDSSWNPPCPDADSWYYSGKLDAYYRGWESFFLRQGGVNPYKPSGYERDTTYEDYEYEWWGRGYEDASNFR